MCNKVVLLMEKLPKFTQIISGRAKNQTWAVWSQGLCARLLHYAASLKASAEKWSIIDIIIIITILSAYSPHQEYYKYYFI